jgi:Arc/MetJ family transcription regulator
MNYETLTYRRHMTSFIFMRTTLDLPEGLVEEAPEAIGFKSKTDTVVFALREIVRRSKVQDLKKLILHLQYDYDPTLIRKKERDQLRSLS